MKVSIITVVYNGVEHVGDCIKSVLSQTHKDIEYIVIDGASSDGTMQVVDSFKNRIACIISEKDKGMYYALNKGILMAKGDVVGFLHSDDLYADEHSLEKVVKIFGTEGVESVYAGILYVEKNNTNRIIRYWRSERHTESLFRKGWMPPHTSFFVKKIVYEKHGLFNTSFKIAADYELMLRFLYKYRISSFFLDDAIVKMRYGGVSNRNISNIIAKSREDRMICKSYNLGYMSLLMKNLQKLPQFILRPSHRA